MLLRKKTAVIAVVVVALIAVTAVGLTRGQSQKDEKKADAPVVMQFTQADVARVEKRDIARSITFRGRWH